MAWRLNARHINTITVRMEDENREQGYLTPDARISRNLCLFFGMLVKAMGLIIRSRSVR